MHRESRIAKGSDESWVRDLMGPILQEPLVESSASLRALKTMRPARRPRSVFLGIGLCSRAQLGAALPVDVLGMLLPAERIRESIGAASLVVLVADQHAVCNGLDPDRVERRARDTVRMLGGIRDALGLAHMRILRASEFHDTSEYRAVLAGVERQAPPGEHAYVTRQIADCEYLHRRCGGIVKVGWCTDRNGHGGEHVFDRRFRDWIGDHVGFVYCKAGRVLDDHTRKASPYLAVDADARICLAPGENVRAKLHFARAHASEPTICGVRKHLRALTYSACRRVGPIRGSVEDRVQGLISRVVTHARHGADATPLFVANRAGQAVTSALEPAAAAGG